MAQDMTEKELRQMELDQLKKEVKLERQMVMGFKCTLLKKNQYFCIHNISEVLVYI